MLDKIKLYLSIFGGLIIATLGLEFLRRGQKIKDLQNENAVQQSETVVAKSEGELNELHKQTSQAEIDYSKSSSDLDRAQSELSEIERNRPK